MAWQSTILPTKRGRPGRPLTMDRRQMAVVRTPTTVHPESTCQEPNETGEDIGPVDPVDKQRLGERHKETQGSRPIPSTRTQPTMLPAAIPAIRPTTPQQTPPTRKPCISEPRGADMNDTLGVTAKHGTPVTGAGELIAVPRGAGTIPGLTLFPCATEREAGPRPPPAGREPLPSPLPPGDPPSLFVPWQ